MESKDNNSITPQKLKTKIEQILPDYITSDILLKPALCIKVPKKDTSGLLSKLKKNNLVLDKIYLKGINYHIKNIDKEYQKPTNITKEESSEYKEYEGTFLKRVKNYNGSENLVLVSFLDDLSYKKITKEKIIEDYALKESDLIEIEIPCTESISNEQYYKNNKIWPQCNYISSKEKYIYNHSEKEKKEILGIFNEYFINNNKDNISSLLYNPKTKKVVGKASKNEKSIIGHSIMNLLDLFSKKLVDNKNVNKHEDKDKIENNKNNDEKFEDVKLGEKKVEGPKENTDLLFNFEDNNENGDSGHQYYCEDLYVLSTDEPCMMCSMALIHNRISRFYFCNVNEKEGALISKYSLDNYNLNHHYLIFKLI